MNLTESPLPPGARVVAYLRDSGGEEQELSIPQQEQTAREWCQRAGLELVTVYADSMTGTSTAGRHQFLEMIHSLHHTRDIHGVLIWRSNRFGRNINDSQYYKADLRRRGYIIHSLTDKIPEGSAGAIVEFALDWKDQVYSEQLSEDVKRGLAYIVQTYGAIPGTPPRGFMRVPITVGNRRNGKPHQLARWQPDPQTAPLAKLAFEMRARGAELKDISRATGLYKSKNCWKTFFDNALYYGELHFGGLVIPNYCEAIIDKETWQAAQAVGRARSWMHRTDHPRRAGSGYPLSGLVYCQECGAALSMHTIKERDEYYDCSNKMRTGECKARAIPRAALENIVTQTLREKVFQPEHLQIIEQSLLELYHSRQSNHARRETLSQRETQLKRELENILAAIRAAGHSSALISALQTIETELSSTRAELRELFQENTPPTQHSPAELQRISEKLQTALTQNAPDLRAFLRGFVVRILAERTPDEIRGLIEYYPPQTQNPPRGGSRGNQGSAPTGTQTIQQIHFTTPNPPRKKRTR